MSEQVTFTRRGLARGAVQILPIALVDVPFAIVLGVLARQAGLSTAEITLMSMLVFAGASQLIAVGLWAFPVPVLTIVLTTLIVNVRHLLMGAAGMSVAWLWVLFSPVPRLRNLSDLEAAAEEQSNHSEVVQLTDIAA